MALGGLAAALAGFPQGLADAQERARKEQIARMQQMAFIQELQDRQKQRQAAGAAFSTLTSGAGEVQMPQPAGMPSGGQMQLPSVPDTGGAFPRQPMPNARPTMAPSMGGGMSAGGAIPARGTAERERLKSLIYSDESGGRNVDQGVVPPGGGFNPSVGRVTGPSSASGYGQITDSTLRDVQRTDPTLAGYRHAKDMPFQLQDRATDDLIDKRGVQPWAPYNANLRKDLAQPETAKMVGLTERQVAQSVPPMVQGNMNLRALAQAVEKANPAMPDYLKMQVVEHLQKLMGPQSQQQWEQFKFQAGQEEKQREFDIRERELRQSHQETQQYRQDSLDIRRGQQEGSGFQFITRPDGSVVRANPKTGEMQPVDLPAGSGKMGGAAGQPPSQSEVKYWATVLKNGGSLPAGLARTREGSNLVRAIMKEAGAEGDPNEFIVNHATVKANTTSLTNMTKMTDAAESFERTANANLDNALRLSKGAVPTDLGPWVNRWIEGGMTQFGNEQVPPYLAAVLTAANEYAKIMNGSTGSQGSTVDSRREAAELLSPYLSTGQITEVAKVLKQDMANRKRELEGQVADIRGRLKAGPSNTAPDQRSPGSLQPSGPQPGTVENGYRFKGGDPSDQNAWEPVK